MRPRYFVLVPVGLWATGSCYSSWAGPGENGSTPDDVVTGGEAETPDDIAADGPDAEGAALRDDVSLDDASGPDDPATAGDEWVEGEADAVDVPAEEVDDATDGASDGTDAGWRGCDAGDCDCLFPYHTGGLGDCDVVLGWNPMAEGVCMPIRGCSCGAFCDGIPFLEGRQYWTCSPSYHDVPPGPWDARQACECCPTLLDPTAR